MASGNFTITLDEEDYNRVLKELEELSHLERSRVLRKGLAEGGRLFINEGKKYLEQRLSTDPVNVKMRKGLLKKAFKLKVYPNRGKVHAGFDRKGRHAHLVDRGTDKRYTRKGAYRGSVAKGSPNTGNMFWTDAFNAKKDEASRILMEAIRREIQNITK